MSDEKACIPNIEVTAGTIFEVRLDTQSGTGYTWALAHKPDCVKFIEKSNEVKQSNVYGSSEVEIFTFSADEKAQDSLTFDYIRPGEPENVARSETFSLIINEKDTADELQNLAGCPQFASFDNNNCSGVAAMYMGLTQGQQLNVIPPYMGPIKYMGPPVMKYMGPVIKYMGPPVLKYMGPIAPEYMAPIENKEVEEI